MQLDALDRAIVRATQSGLPLTPRPYHDVAELIGISAEEVMERMKRMLRLGVIRRIGAIPNHYAIGYVANGMSVWDVDDAVVDDLGERLALSGLVSHCYLRRRQPPLWPYNLFAMVHGHDRAQVEEKVRRIAELLGSASRGYEVLYSSRILKKTGLRLT
ncbi:MAG TPA: AsnC family transcriptional regulator [Burkholderiales bacterium]|nr:AsnC family transcriptional regulator [Burkholderiales bacterium]